MKASPAAIGFRVKTGRATAVMLGGPAASPQLLQRRAIKLSDPKVPESFQPYHAALELPEKEGAKVVARAFGVVRAMARQALDDLARELKDSGHALRGVGLVVGSNTKADKIANPHIRAHALEGLLFRQVLEEAAEGQGVPCLVVLERDAFAKGAGVIGRTPDALKRMVVEFGGSVGPPWGAEEKTATVAAWMALAR